MKLRYIFAALAGTLVLSGMPSQEASALSCRQPDLIRTLEDAKASEKLYYILVGRFVTETNTRPDYRDQENKLQRPYRRKPPKITRSWFEGYSVAQDPRADSYLTRFPVDIQTSCAGPWCSSPPSGDREVIAFVEAREPQAPLLKVSPCPTWVFPVDAQNAKVQTIRDCLDKSCAPTTP